MEKQQTWREYIFLTFPEKNSQKDNDREIETKSRRGYKLKTEILNFCMVQERKKYPRITRKIGSEICVAKWPHCFKSVERRKKFFLMTKSVLESTTTKVQIVGLTFDFFQSDVN